MKVLREILAAPLLLTALAFVCLALMIGYLGYAIDGTLGKK